MDITAHDIMVNQNDDAALSTEENSNDENIRQCVVLQKQNIALHTKHIYKFSTLLYLLSFKSSPCALASSIIFSVGFKKSTVSRCVGCKHFTSKTIQFIYNLIYAHRKDKTPLAHANGKNISPITERYITSSNTSYKRYSNTAQ